MPANLETAIAWIVWGSLFLPCLIGVGVIAYQRDRGRLRWRRRAG